MNDTLAIPRGLTAALSKAGLGIAGTVDRIKITAPNGAGVDYAIDGIAYHKADGDNIDVSAAVQAGATTCLYLVQVDVDGNVTIVKGTEELNTALAAGTRVLHWPTVSDGKCPIGAVKVKTTANAFTFGTTNLDDADVTDTYYDFAGSMPIAPLTS